ncbi:MAG: GntR family transcriptional regulator [Lachnospiraceae bacterium]|nr:GntR family transcriptional regulator [Lachnospiraceae bacterium]
MIYYIDESSDEAFYIQLRNQIICAIANATIRNGDSLPSVRDMAEEIGINMHTVNKAYAILRQEGYLTLDRRRGAVISIDMDKLEALDRLKDQMRVILAQAVCKNVSREEIHEIADEVLNEFSGIN